MPRSRSAWCFISVAVLLAVPAPASAGPAEDLEKLSERRLPGPPLVPTQAPAKLRPLERTMSIGSGRRRSAYLIRLVRDPGILALEGNGYTSMAQARRDLVRRQGFRARATRIRGKAGLALTRRSPRGHALVWRENGMVFWMATSTPQVTAADLRTTAASLDSLEHGWRGSGGDPELPTGALLATTERTVTGNVEWGARCTNPDGSFATSAAGAVEVNFLPRAGERFSFSLAGRRTGTLRWSGEVSGTVAADAITLNVRATTSLEGVPCDTGPVTLRLTRPG